MLKIFGGGGKPNHPMADFREARAILDQLPAGDAHKAVDEAATWLESVRATEEFRPEYRAELVKLIDDAAQPHVRKLARSYLSSPRLSKFQEGRLWGAIHEYWRQAAMALASCADLYATGARGADALKPQMPTIAVRALRALGGQMKWQYIRYGPFEDSLWGIVARIYALAESRKFTRTQVTVHQNLPGESSPEQEFLKVVMLAACSPDSLLPVEIEIAERLIAHFSSMFTLAAEEQPDIAHWIDLATGHAPLRIARPPQHAPTLRFFAAGKAEQGLHQLLDEMKRNGAVPAQVNLGGSYDPQLVRGVLDHLATVWSPRPPKRRTPRHRVKSRLTVTHGFDGVLSALTAEMCVDFEASGFESWIIEDVSAGGFGASIPQIKGDWLRIGALVALQPDGGSNWVLGIICRLSRESLHQGAVGIETLARYAQVLQLRPEGASSDVGTQPGILLDSASTAAGEETTLLLRPGALPEGQNLQYQQVGRSYLLLPSGVEAQGEDYETVRFRRMVREDGD